MLNIEYKINIHLHKRYNQKPQVSLEEGNDEYINHKKLFHITASYDRTELNHRRSAFVLHLLFFGI